MATKNAAGGNKRKLGPGGQVKPDSRGKKARIEAKPAKPQPESTEESDDFEDFSDSDDGGVRLEKDASSGKSSKRTDNATKDKTFERGTLSIDRLHQATSLTLRRRDFPRVPR